MYLSSVTANARTKGARLVYNTTNDSVSSSASHLGSSRDASNWAGLSASLFSTDLRLFLGEGGLRPEDAVRFLHVLLAAPMICFDNFSSEITLFKAVTSAFAISSELIHV